MDMDGKKKIVFIGAGHVATRMSLAMRDAGYTVVQVFSRTSEHARMLGEKLPCSFITETGQITPEAGIYVFSVRDDALQRLITEIPANKGLWIHTAGSVPANVFEGHVERYGVIYPLQTLSKNRETDFHKIPLFIEGNTGASER